MIKKKKQKQKYNSKKDKSDKTLFLIKKKQQD